MVARENAGGGSADLFRGFETTTFDTPLQLFEPCAHPVHGLDALCALIRQALFGVDHEHPHAWLGAGNLLHQRLGRCRLLAGGNADRTFGPGPGCALDIVEYLGAAAALAADKVALAAPPHGAE